MLGSAIVVLHVLVGYRDRPMGIELLFYAVTFAAIAALMRIVGARAARVARLEANAGSST
ncbi:MAG: hypothetical protein A3G24_05835 [Betaproteobacteria bacterium RIFCSPLOWO2_12_FULL_62_13]|nr:MAG: hypothetical protein A3G24_05835 [Betaproteobacteria bacterium RIFCSPLOWO2_12_FULL_62_13]